MKHLPMSKNEIRERIEYINSIELPEAQSALDVQNQTQVSYTDDTRSSYVNNGSLVTFVDGISSQNKQDVLNSTLLAQLAATKKYDRNKDTENWYKLYIATLNKIGWIEQALSFSQYHAGGTTFTVDKVVIDIMRAIASENEQLVIQETLNALESLSNDKGQLILFEDSAQSSGHGNFQISSANESEDKNIALNLGAFYFTSTQHETRFLWLGYSTSDTTIFTAKDSLVLNEQIYAQFRQTIINKLGDRIKLNIDEIEI